MKFRSKKIFRLWWVKNSFRKNCTKLYNTDLIRVHEKEAFLGEQIRKGSISGFAFSNSFLCEGGGRGGGCVYCLIKGFPEEYKMLSTDRISYAEWHVVELM